MKLIMCRKCLDIVRLIEIDRKNCDCEASWGYYKDDLNAVYGGEAIPIAILNSSIISAIGNQPEEGDGRRFDAFIVPKQCDTFKREVT